ncbi:hypothetical protein B0T18DRAFT_463982 [Schizothecium vesticola]|uniref:2EXR domain-containing protein n=1 Tax=Schizothecium vesticola TaxID=314040 RepID=A0AA40K4K1_9PEZI|nr:hypothetical protein B0T18DRAFT_463982 [Schizothecium vesticola]
MPDVYRSPRANLIGMALLGPQKGNTGDDNNATISANATFPRFRHLPAKIQIAIWEMAAASPILTPEYAPADDWVEGWDNFQESASGFDINLPPNSPVKAYLMVLTSWSPLMHTCFDSRAAALRSSSLPLRFSTAAGFHVPCRPFATAIDTVYFVQSEPLRIYHTFPQIRTVLKEARHLVPYNYYFLAISSSTTRSKYCEFCDANDCRPKGFDLRESITTRRRMRVVQVSDLHEDSVVLMQSID